MMQHDYKGVAISRSLPGGRAGGTITISPGVITFVSENSTKNFSMEGVKISRGGSNNHLIFFNHPSSPDWTFYTEDKKILNNNILKIQPSTYSQVKAISDSSFRFILKSLAAIAAVTGIVYASWIGVLNFKDYSIRFISEKIPISWEEKLGDMALDESSGKYITDKHIQTELARITTPITKVVLEDSARKYKFSFLVARDSNINAFALPGGKIVINSGLILKAQSPEEIAGVIAHEIAHVTKQHGVKQLVQTIGIYLLMQTLLGDIEGIMAIMMQNSGMLLNLKFSREFELEADDAGYASLKKAGINPQGMISFFRKLEENEKSIIGENNGDLLSLISTHPATAERVERLDKRISLDSNSSSYKRIDINFRQFQESIKKRL